MAFIRGRDLMAEIWKSKLSYCDVYESEYTTPDVITDDLQSITTPDLTIRLDTDDHVPRLAHDAKPRRGGLAGLDRGVTFAPFRLYRSYVVGGVVTYREVARSHWKRGVYDPQRGRLTDALGVMIVQMIDSYARRPNWNGYSWVDEMKSEAMLILCRVILGFNEARSTNPHAYVTRIMENAFRAQLSAQKHHSKVRDALLHAEGSKPSMNAQHEDLIGRAGKALLPPLKANREPVKVKYVRRTRPDVDRQPIQKPIVVKPKSEKPKIEKPIRQSKPPKPTVERPPKPPRIEKPVRPVGRPPKYGPPAPKKVPKLARIDKPVRPAGRPPKYGPPTPKVERPVFVQRIPQCSKKIRGWHAIIAQSAQSLIFNILDDDLKGTTEIVNKTGLSRATALRHLKIIHDVGLIEVVGEKPMHFRRRPGLSEVTIEVGLKAAGHRNSTAK